MVQAFVEAPRDWNPIPGTNRPQREADGSYKEVVRIYPIPAISGNFHLQLMAQWKIEKLVVVNHCPMLYVRQRLCGALSSVQFSVALDYAEADSRFDFIARFKAYGYELMVLGRRDTFIGKAPPSRLYFVPPSFSLAGK